MTVKYMDSLSNYLDQMDLKEGRDVCTVKFGGIFIKVGRAGYNDESALTKPNSRTQYVSRHCFQTLH